VDNLTYEDVPIKILECIQHSKIIPQELESDEVSSSVRHTRYVRKFRGQNFIRRGDCETQIL